MRLDGRRTSSHVDDRRRMGGDKNASLYFPILLFLQA